MRAVSRVRRVAGRASGVASIRVLRMAGGPSGACGNADAPRAGRQRTFGQHRAAHALGHQRQHGLHRAHLGQHVELHAALAQHAVQQAADGIRRAGQHQRIVGQRSQGHARRQMALRRRDQQQLLAHQRLVGELRRRQRIEQQGQVQAPRDQCLAQRQAQAFQHRDDGAREALAKAAHQRYRQAQRHARRHAHGHPASRLATKVQHGVARALGGGQHLACVHDEGLTRGRELHTPPGAHQQAVAELLLQQRHLSAEAGLRQVQRDRGAAEAAAVGDRDQGLQLPQLHSHRSYRL